MTTRTSTSQWCAVWSCRLLTLTFICVTFIIVQQPSQVVSSSERPPVETEDLHYCDVTSDCPTWFRCNNHTCECNNRPEYIIKCDGKRASVLPCYCVTEDQVSNRGLVVGSCIFNCARRPKDDIYYQYFVIPLNISTLNEDTCGRFNRTGRLCGNCLPNLSSKVYSFSLSCVECNHVYINWLLFILSAFVPLTVFYLLILLFNINAVSSTIHAFIQFSQFVSSPPLARAIENSPDQNSFTVVTKILISFYGIWNLDFFRFFGPVICFNTNSLVSLSLDYVVAIYPLFLVCITYLLISLHDRNFKALLIVCKPFKVCFSWFQKAHRANRTIIDAFVTFFVLSFVKIISVSFDLLYPVPLYAFNSSDVTYALFYDGGIAYFGKDHLPFAILAILFLLFFVIIPVMILLFYPYRWFQRTLSCLPSRWYLFLQTFVDSIQGCFEDGTEQRSRDYRSFAGLYFVLRIAALLVYFFTLNSTFYIICGILFLLFVMLLLILRPYKPEFSRHTHLNAGFLVLLTCLWFSLTGLSTTFSRQLNATFLGFAVVCLTLPLMYSIYCVLHWLYLQRKNKICVTVASSFLCLCSRCVPVLEHVEESPSHIM